MENWIGVESSEGLSWTIGNGWNTCSTICERLCNELPRLKEDVDCLCGVDGCTPNGMRISDVCFSSPTATNNEKEEIFGWFSAMGNSEDFLARC